MQPYVLTICSGKGGVGKSILASNIAEQLASRSEKTLLIDLDLMFPNLHLMFGLSPSNNAIEKYIMIKENLFILNHLSLNISHSTLDSFSFIDVYHNILFDDDFDFIIIDTSSGLSNYLLEAACIADKIGIVVTDEPTSMVDSYGLIKIMQDYIDIRKVNLILNNIIDYNDANELILRFNIITKHFINAVIDTLGVVQYDDAMKKSIIEQMPLSIMKPGSATVNDIIAIAKKLIEIRIRN